MIVSYENGVFQLSEKFLPTEYSWTIYTSLENKKIELECFSGADTIYWDDSYSSICDALDKAHEIMRKYIKCII